MYIARPAFVFSFCDHPFGLDGCMDVSYIYTTDHLCRATTVVFDKAAAAFLPIHAC